MSEPGRHQLTIAPDSRPDSDQPAWRREFPIDMARDHYVTRRDFTKFLGLTSLAFVVGQCWILFQNWRRQRTPAPAEMEIAKLSQLPVGASLPFAFPGENDTCLLLRPEENKLLAYNRKCTHLSCAVVPDVSQKRLDCPCHNGVFDLETGRPLAGPPRRPLTRISLTVRGDTIYATGVELRSI